MIERASRSGLSRVSVGVALVLGMAVGAACTKPRALSAVDRGAVIYRTNCISCHNADPNLPGPIGPAIATAPRALLEARVLHGTYPPGYTPQRRTHTMRALPWLDGHVDDLAAYLAAVSAHRPRTRPRSDPAAGLGRYGTALAQRASGVVSCPLARRT